MKLVLKKFLYSFPVFLYSVCTMNNELLDPQNETHSLAVVTTEELPGYAEWCAEWEAQQEQDWAEALGQY